MLRFLEFLKSQRAKEIIKNMDYEPFLLSAKILLICLFLFLSFGVLIAYYLASSKSKFAFLVESLVILPLIFPSVAIGFFLLVILGKNGFLGTFFAKFDIFLSLI